MTVRQKNADQKRKQAPIPSVQQPLKLPDSLLPTHRTMAEIKAAVAKVSSRK